MSSGTPSKPLLSIAEAADLLGKSRSATYQLARRDELPGLVVLNGRYHVKRAVIVRWLEEDASADDPLVDVKQRRAADDSAAQEGA